MKNPDSATLKANIGASPKAAKLNPKLSHQNSKEISDRIDVHPVNQGASRATEMKSTSPSRTFLKKGDGVKKPPKPSNAEPEKHHLGSPNVRLSVGQNVEHKIEKQTSTKNLLGSPKGRISVNMHSEKVVKLPTAEKKPAPKAAVRSTDNFQVSTEDKLVETK